MTARDSYTGKGYSFMAPWNSSSLKYGEVLLNLNYISIGNLEVVVLLNIVQQAEEMYYQNNNSYNNKYNPKVYISSSQTVGYLWLTQRQNTPSSTWPES